MMVRGPQAYPLPPASQESFHATLTQAGALYLLDMRSVPDREVRTWLEGPHRGRRLSAPFVHQVFDVLIQLDRLSPTHLLPKE